MFCTLGKAQPSPDRHFPFAIPTTSLPSMVISPNPEVWPAPAMPMPQPCVGLPWSS